MKNFLSGSICICLLLVAVTLPGIAQEPKPGQQFLAQSGSVTDTAAAASPSDAASTTALPAQPADDPASDASADQPEQSPQQAPAGQTPAGQTPVAPADQPKQVSRVPELPPPPVKVPDVRRPGESGLWIGIQGWFPKQQPILNKGTGTNYTDSSLATLEGNPKYAEGFEAGLAVGLHNTLKFSYFSLHASGDFTTGVDLEEGSQVYTAGTYVSTNYHLQDFKLSFEFLSWPYPVGSRKIRLKSLWQVQYMSVGTTFDSPLDYYNSSGNQIIDPTTGQPVDLSDSETKHILSPVLGLGLYYYPSRHVRLELNATGFGWPHHYSIWDSDASLNVRLIKHFELRGGIRALGFKTSTNADYFIKSRYAAVFFGLRWYSNSE